MTGLYIQAKQLIETTKLIFIYIYKEYSKEIIMEENMDLYSRPPDDQCQDQRGLLVLFGFAPVGFIIGGERKGSELSTAVVSSLIEIGISICPCILSRCCQP